MRTKDLVFILIVIAVFLPFVVSDALYGWYLSFNAEHGMVMSFLKFGILATMGELLGLRISRGVYYFKGFHCILNRSSRICRISWGEGYSSYTFRCSFMAKGSFGIFYFRGT